MENAFNEDFRFTSPYDDEIDKPAYFAHCWRGTGWIERHELERIFVKGDDAFVSYKCVAKGRKSFRNTEFFTFKGGRIKRIDVYFGATYQNGAFVRQQEKLNRSYRHDERIFEERTQSPAQRHDRPCRER